MYVEGPNGGDKEGKGSQRNGMDIMTHYKIICEFIGDLPPGSKSTLKLHIEEVGVAGLIQLYEGVSIYDAFVHENAMNCYKFVAPLILGEDLMDVDINFMKTIK